MEDSEKGIAEKHDNWVVDPALYVLIHEPPARRYKAPGSLGWFVHWHFARGPTDVPQEELKHDTQKFISPVLFIDGHAARHDFTRTIQSDPEHPFEPTKDWIWYKPREPARPAP
jgi:hypothetical protein